jgi:hypothetical protein
MLEACRRHRVQFMDGVMFMPAALDQMRAVLDDGASVGQVKRITSFSASCLGEFFTRNIRNRRAEPYGCPASAGIACASRFAMRGQLPRRVTGRILGKSPGTVPLWCPEFSGELFFDHGVSGFHSLPCA